MRVCMTFGVSRWTMLSQKQCLKAINGLKALQNRARMVSRALWTLWATILHDSQKRRGTVGNLGTWACSCAYGGNANAATDQKSIHTCMYIYIYIYIYMPIYTPTHTHLYMYTYMLSLSLHKNVYRQVFMIIYTETTMGCQDIRMGAF